MLCSTCLFCETFITRCFLLCYSRRSGRFRKMFLLCLDKHAFQPLLASIVPRIAKVLIILVITFWSLTIQVLSSLPIPLFLVFDFFKFSFDRVASFCNLRLSVSEFYQVKIVFWWLAPMRFFLPKPSTFHNELYFSIFIFITILIFFCGLILLCRSVTLVFVLLLLVSALYCLPGQ